MKEYTGFIGNFHHKQEASMFAKIILYIKVINYLVYTALMSLRCASGTPRGLDSVELASAAPSVALLTTETAVKPHACEIL